MPLFTTSDGFKVATFADVKPGARRFNGDGRDFVIPAGLSDWHVKVTDGNGARFALSYADAQLCGVDVSDGPQESPVTPDEAAKRAGNVLSEEIRSAQIEADAASKRTFAAAVSQTVDDISASLSNGLGVALDTVKALLWVAVAIAGALILYHLFR